MNNTYKIRISDRNATVYDVVDAYSLKSVAMPKGLNPIQSKLMNQDIFRCDLGSFELLHSSARSMEVIPVYWFWREIKRLVREIKNIIINVFQMIRDYLCS